MVPAPPAVGGGREHQSHATRPQRSADQRRRENRGVKVDLGPSRPWSAASAHSLRTFQQGFRGLPPPQTLRAEPASVRERTSLGSRAVARLVRGWTLSEMDRREQPGQRPSLYLCLRKLGQCGVSSEIAFHRASAPAPRQARTHLHTCTPLHTPARPCTHLHTPARTHSHPLAPARPAHTRSQTEAASGAPRGRRRSSSPRWMELAAPAHRHPGSPGSPDACALQPGVRGPGPICRAAGPRPSCPDARVLAPPCGHQEVLQACCLRCNRAVCAQSGSRGQYVQVRGHRSGRRRQSEQVTGRGSLRRRQYVQIRA